MILKSNIPAICDRARTCDRVLDVGGWFRPFNLATHVLDLGRYETRRSADALDPENPQRFTAETWIRHDACVSPWPFTDGYFDFSICSHLLEDVRDPIAVCRELSRVSRAGYIEVPSRAREIFCKQRFPRMRMLLGRAPEVGFPHHRWFVEYRAGRLVFIAKTAGLLTDPHCYITRGELGRKMTEQESGLGIFWTGSIDAVEELDVQVADLRSFKAAALKRLRTLTPLRSS